MAAGASVGTRQSKRRQSHPPAPVQTPAAVPTAAVKKIAGSQAGKALSRSRSQSEDDSSTGAGGAGGLPQRTSSFGLTALLGEMDSPPVLAGDGVFSPGFVSACPL